MLDLFSGSATSTIRYWFDTKWKTAERNNAGGLPKSTLKASPIVFAALAVSHWIGHQTGWSIKKFVRTARRYRTVRINGGRQTLTTADPLTDDLRSALAAINTRHAHMIHADPWT